MDKQFYGTYVNKREKKTPCTKNMILAFVSGGIVCCIGKMFADLYAYFGMEKEISTVLSSCTLIVLAGLFTGIGCFDKAAKIFGAGLLVPITGFSNAVASPAIDAKSEGFIMGVGVEMFKIAGPVIVYGNLCAVIYGVIYYFCRKL